MDRVVQERVKRVVDSSGTELGYAMGVVRW